MQMHLESPFIVLMVVTRLSHRWSSLGGGVVVTWRPYLFRIRSLSNHLVENKKMFLKNIHWQGLETRRVLSPIRFPVAQPYPSHVVCVEWFGGRIRTYGPNDGSRRLGLFSRPFFTPPTPGVPVVLLSVIVVMVVVVEVGFVGGGRSRSLPKSKYLLVQQKKKKRKKRKTYTRGPRLVSGPYHCHDGGGSCRYTCNVFISKNSFTH